MCINNYYFYNFITSKFKISYILLLKMEEDLLRKCRICLELEENSLGQGAEDLISPCNCRGTQKYVHKSCLAEWQRVSLQQPNPRRAYECSVCKTIFSFKPKEKFGKKILQLILPPVWARQFLVGSFGLVYIFNARQLPLVLQYLAAFAAIYFSFRLRIGMADGDPVPAVMSGCYLVADRIPRGSVFFQSVVLILQHDSNVGSLGVIINHARDIGGPVASWESVILTSNGSSEFAAVEGVPGLFWRRSVIRAFEGEGGDSGARVKVLRGICGWGSRQLDGEVRRGSWKVMRADADSALETHTDPTLWQNLYQTAERFH
jgi:putative AlgH/UPF0301 family transcriptional regulator